MLTLEVKDIKSFMQKLLKEEVFDDFLFINALVESSLRFEIAKIEQDILFKNVRINIFDFIKGKELPSKMKFVFGKRAEFLPNIENSNMLFLNIIYFDGKMQLTSAVSYKSFSTDKQDIKIWSDYILEFLKDNNIIYEEN